MNFLADISTFTGLSNAAAIQENKGTLLDTQGTANAYKTLRDACSELKQSAGKVDNKLAEINYYCDYCRGRIADDTRTEIQEMIANYGLNKSTFRNQLFPLLKAARGIKIK